MFPLPKDFTIEGVKDMAEQELLQSIATRVLKSDKPDVIAKVMVQRGMALLASVSDHLVMKEPGEIDALELETDGEGEPDEDWEEYKHLLTEVRAVQQTKKPDIKRRKGTSASTAP
eukprot:2389833-Amphidinium_carterae.1